MSAYACVGAHVMHKQQLIDRQIYQQRSTSRKCMYHNDIDICLCFVYIVLGAIERYATFLLILQKIVILSTKNQWSIFKNVKAQSLFIKIILGVHYHSIVAKQSDCYL